MNTHVISVGEWSQSLFNRMNNAVEGDVFCLPTPMHLHAYELIKEQYFDQKQFKVEVIQTKAAA
jgi:sortase (surface protein transpeptidase)